MVPLENNFQKYEKNIIRMIIYNLLINQNIWKINITYQLGTVSNHVR